MMNVIIFCTVIMRRVVKSENNNVTTGFVSPHRYVSPLDTLKNDRLSSITRKHVGFFSAPLMSRRCTLNTTVFNGSL